MTRRRRKGMVAIERESLTGAVLHEDWTRPCPGCGQPYRLQLRVVDGVVRDQPMCGSCRNPRGVFP